MITDQLPAMLGILLVLAGGALAVLVRRPRARPAAHDPRPQATADRAEARAVEAIQAREDAIKAEGAEVLAESDELEKARQAARMRG